jgi:hypothetical protein
MFMKAHLAVHLELNHPSPDLLVEAPPQKSRRLAELQALPVRRAFLALRQLALRKS